MCTGDFASDLTSLPNIGKVFAGKLRRIGIDSAEDFLSRDPYEVFDELRAGADPTLCRCALACLVGAKRNAKWFEITKETAKRYEALHPGHEWGKC